ncbi:MAG: hypothetical protein AB1486_22245, partial [Planctomycetota bacterium]
MRRHATGVTLPRDQAHRAGLAHDRAARSEPSASLWGPFEFQCRGSLTGPLKTGRSYDAGDRLTEWSQSGIVAELFELDGANNWCRYTAGSSYENAP